MPKFTVIMPIYNSELWMKKAIESVIHQTFNDWHLVLVDDGSTDDSVNIANEYVDLFPKKIRLLQQDNSGPAVARELGFLNSKSLYVVLLDSDDYFDTDYLYKINTKTHTNPDVIIPELMSQNGNGDFYSFNKKNKLTSGMQFTGKNAFRLTFPWKIHGFACYKTDLMVKCATGENSNYTNYNADEYITRIVFLNAKNIIVSEGKYFHLANIESLTKKPSLRRLGFLLTEKKLIELTEQYDYEFLNEVLSDSLRKLFISFYTYKMNSKFFDELESKEIFNKHKDHYLFIKEYKFNYVSANESILKNVLYKSFKYTFLIPSVASFLSKFLK